eukprot:746285-Hanusia_phi.AAC.6
MYRTRTYIVAAPHSWEAVPIPSHLILVFGRLIASIKRARPQDRQKANSRSPLRRLPVSAGNEASNCSEGSTVSAGSDTQATTLSPAISSATCLPRCRRCLTTGCRTFQSANGFCHKSPHTSDGTHLWYLGLLNLLDVFPSNLNQNYQILQSAAA